MTVFEKMRRKQIPEYYDGMYLDGFTPQEIIEAAHNSLLRDAEARQEAKAVEPPMNVRFQVEVKK